MAARLSALGSAQRVYLLASRGRRRTLPPEKEAPLGPLGELAQVPDALADHGPAYGPAQGQQPAQKGFFLDRYVY